ncbi:MAG TPA: trehalose-phosphatase [Candidatus Micrarchaeaceae archaeon]|nr:trehalose-phosphatase [Candidatus Micrarchaeaceae archaeon]
MKRLRDQDRERPARDKMQRFEELFPPLVGLHQVGEPKAGIERGDLQPALAKLGDVRPGQLLLATDFDGTLAPITAQPENASALPENLAIIDLLIDCGVHVAVISGRAQHDLRARLPIAGSRLLGDNGIGGPTVDERRALDRYNSKAGPLIARQAGVWLESKPGSTSVHYRNAPHSGPDLRAALLPIANRFGLVATVGRMVIEVAPRRADKARALLTLIGGLEPKAVIYAGDDQPDQTVFEMVSRLPRPHLSIGVCSAERPATQFQDCDLVVDGPDGMSAFLRALSERMARARLDDPWSVG